MSLLKVYLTFFLLSLSFSALSKPLVFSEKELASPPNRIIRTCCSFGSDLRVMALPTVKVNHITNLEKIGSHHYLGDIKEGNGIIYTTRGGFIDMAHLRDQADWTAYLYALIKYSKNKPGLLHKLGHEGGTKTLDLHLPADLDSTDAILLAGRISYDLSVWHEIATWFGASYIPMLTERHSSFSIEDAYSNLLGVRLGMQALQSELPFEQAMTQLIAQTLKELGAVTNEADTYSAMEVVRNIWWTRAKKLPSGKVLLERQLQVYATLSPLTVPGMGEANEKPLEQTVPEFTQTGKKLTDLYSLIIKPNYKFPLRDIFPNEIRRFVTQHDFNTLLQQVSKEWLVYLSGQQAALNIYQHHKN